MPRKRSTILLADLAAEANRHLAYAGTPDARRGIAQLLESMLHSANAYVGFGYLPSELTTAFGSTHLLADHDDTRRFYYYNGSRAGYDQPSLLEAVRWVAQNLRQAGPALSPAAAVEHARSAFDKYTIPDEATALGRAYRLVIEATDGEIDRVLRARYGQRYDAADIPS